MGRAAAAASMNDEADPEGSSGSASVTSSIECYGRYGAIDTPATAPCTAPMSAPGAAAANGLSARSR